MLFTFPSQYSYAIGLTRVFSLTGWSRRIRAEFLVFRVTQDTTRPEQDSCKGLSPAMVCLSRQFHSPLPYHDVVLQPLRGVATTQVWALPRSLATTGGIIVYFLFLRVLRCFSSPRWPLRKQMSCLQHDGLSHSEIGGSTVICTYPPLIAAYHVLHRLNEPRHPPCALSYFRLTLLYPSTWDRGRRPYFSCVLWMSPTGGLYLAYDSLAAAQALQSCLCQYVKDLVPYKGWWRISDSNR